MQSKDWNNGFIILFWKDEIVAEKNIENREQNIENREQNIENRTQNIENRTQKKEARGKRKIPDGVDVAKGPEQWTYYIVLEVIGCDKSLA